MPVRVPPISREERERLDLIRLDRGLSYAALAEAIGVTVSTLRTVLHVPSRAARDTTVYRIRQWLQGQPEVIHR